MSKVKTIKELVDGNKERVYVYLADSETKSRFIADAEKEGYTFEGGVNLSERTLDDFYALNRNRTVNFIGSVGRMTFQCNAEHIVRVDYKKYISENEDYYYDKSPHFSEIWMCNLTNGDGSIQNGYRPVFILSNNKNNTYSTTLNIIPITSKMSKRRLPVHVELWSYKKYGLKFPSTMLIEQITTVTVDCLDRYIGIVNDKKTLNNISNAIAIQFPIIYASQKLQ